MELSRTALVVDDEISLLRLVTKVLERADYRVFAAASAQEARRLLADCADPLDVVMLDVFMPDGEGAETLLPEILAQQPEAHVVVASGDQLPASLEAELERVGGHFLRKPFAPKGLLGLLERLSSPLETSPRFVGSSGSSSSGGPSSSGGSH